MKIRGGPPGGTNRHMPTASEMLKSVPRDQRFALFHRLVRDQKRSETELLDAAAQHLDDYGREQIRNIIRHARTQSTAQSTRVSEDAVAIEGSHLHAVETEGEIRRDRAPGHGDDRRHRELVTAQRNIALAPAPDKIRALENEAIRLSALVAAGEIRKPDVVDALCGCVDPRTRSDVEHVVGMGLSGRRALLRATPDADALARAETDLGSSANNVKAGGSFGEGNGKNERDVRCQGRAEAQHNTSRLVTIRASEVKPRNIDFVWPGRLARGKHTSFAGEGGLGKSTVLIDTTARITTGNEWPCGEGRAPKGDVIILSAEDGIEDILVPRLAAAGADMDRAHIVRAVKAENGTGERKFNLQADLGELIKKISELRELGRDVVLVWIDPVTSYMGKVDSHNNTALRGVLDPISEAAERTNVAFASVTHFNKGAAEKGIRALHRVMGGAAFTNAPRAAFAFIRDPHDEDRCLVLHLKNNLAARPPGLAYRIGLWNVGSDPRDNSTIWATHVIWENEPVDMTADEAVAGAAANGVKSGEPTAKDEGIAFYRAILTNGPLLVREIEAQARAAGLLGDTQPILQCKPMRAARDALGIKSFQVKGQRAGGWFWAMPDQVPSDKSDGPSSERTSDDVEGT